MAIEGPLRELGIHDVFQLLDLSRKTGTLRVTSALRDNEGTVEFRNGRVTGATIRSNPHLIGQVLLRSGKISEAELEQARAQHERPGQTRRLAEILVDMGALTQRELERQVRRQIEAVVFELMSWQEGFFAFNEESVHGGIDASAGLSVEALLMEGARRIDEWSRIVHRIPHLAVVPSLAVAEGDQQPMLDLRPAEWELLAAIDGVTDLRTIAATIGASEFDAARIVYGLLATGIVTVHDPEREAGVRAEDDAVMLLSDARDAVRRGDLTRAVECWQRVLLMQPPSPHAEQAREALAHATRLSEIVEVADAG